MRSAPVAGPAPNEEGFTMTDSSGLSRRGFLQAGMLAGAGALAAGALAGCAPRPQETPHPETASQEAHTYWLGEEPAVADADIVATRDTDFLVIGAGNAGSVAALKAQEMGKKVILAAADTFRAAAIEQLTEWAGRAGVELIAQQEGSDPAAVIYDAIAAAKSRNADVLICDTAGRLHNKKNLMEELKKINRIIDKEYPDAYRETLVVLDGTTGQNALAQAKQFMEVADITGIILTKLDGTAKGGIAVAIQSELGIPVKYVGIGEKIDDLQKFDANDFVNALFKRNEALTENE